VKAVADALNLQFFAILGSSSGSLIAVEFAALYPLYVSHLILLGGYVEGRSVRDGEAGASDREVILSMAETGWETPYSAFVTGYISVYFPTATQEQLRQFAYIVQNSCPVENEIRGREFFNAHSITNLLDKVEAKTLVMHSKDDAVHPLSEGQKLAKGIADAQLTILESRNHYPLPEEKSWHTMIAAMLHFLKN